MPDDRGVTPLPLFERFPALAGAVPRLALGDWPTPIASLPNFARAHNLESLHVKREDQSHAACGGSKVRGLEFLLAEAQRRSAGVIVTFGAAGSNHVQTTAWHARQLGIDTVALVVSQPAGDYVRRNLLSGIEVGTHFVPVNLATAAPRLAVEWIWAKRRKTGGVVLIPPGGSSARACLGTVSAGLELGRQVVEGVLPEPELIFVALGSMGTAAGLAVGCRLAGLGSRLVGVATYNRWYCTAGRWAALARRTHAFMRRRDPLVPQMSFHRGDYDVVTTAIGRGYAHPTEASQTVARQLEDSDGLSLDPTYTAKAFHGMMQYIEDRGLTRARSLFWHTYQPTPLAQSKGPSQNAALLPGALRRYLS